MKKMKVSILGHFGHGKELLNGQTVKTKIIAKAMVEALGENEVCCIDTHGGLKVLMKAPFQVLKAVMCSRNIVILPAHNGLRVYAPLLWLAHKCGARSSLHYVVIGGWLPEFLGKRPVLQRQLKDFAGIYVETQSMKHALEKQGFTNILVMPNCKELPILSPEELVCHSQKPYKLCTFSRVMKEKGIEDAINAVRSVNTLTGQTVYTLDIYGQIDSDQQDWFNELQRDFSDDICYKGIVPYDKSVLVLKDYFALLFPTYYAGEGFAGTLLDAMAAGLPVIASDWRYNTEIVRDRVTGLLFPARDHAALIECLLYAQQNVLAWNEMRVQCVNEAQKYLPEKVLKAIVEKIETRE